MGELEGVVVEGEVVEGHDVVINACFGGYSVSAEARMRLMELGMTYEEAGGSYGGPESRDDLRLVQVVKELGPAASGEHASLKVVTIPEGVEWYIEEYDGNEWVAEKHRTWS